MGLEEKKKDIIRNWGRLSTGGSLGEEVVKYFLKACESGRYVAAPVVKAKPVGKRSGYMNF